MKFLIASAVAVLSLQASAEFVYESRNYTCSMLQQSLKAFEVIYVRNFNSKVTTKFVTNHWDCKMGRFRMAGYVRSSDKVFCRVGRYCVEE